MKHDHGGGPDAVHSKIRIEPLERTDHANMEYFRVLDRTRSRHPELDDEAKPTS